MCSPVARLSRVAHPRSPQQHHQAARQARQARISRGAVTQKGEGRHLYFGLTAQRIALAHVRSDAVLLDLDNYGIAALELVKHKKRVCSERKTWDQSRVVRWHQNVDALG